MFGKCSSLLSLSDISGLNININNVNNMNDLFNGCNFFNWKYKLFNNKEKLNRIPIKKNNENKFNGAIKVEQIKTKLEMNRKEDLKILSKIIKKSTSFNRNLNSLNINEINNTNYNINNTLFIMLLNMKIGYAFYKDFKIDNKDYYNEKIKVYFPSKNSINFQKI